MASRFARLPHVFCLGLALLGLAVLVSPALAEKNLQPRLPELVIEKGYSDAFEVEECSVRSQVVNEEAQSQLKFVLKNVSGKSVPRRPDSASNPH